jgi:uncharacterized protein YdhG (YjbR/CyaY superfamily)
VLALAPDRDRTPLIEALAVSNRIMSLGEFLEQRPAVLDSPTRQIYCAYSFALVQLLIDQPDGHKRLARYIGNLPHASNNSRADLEAQFPELADGDRGGIWKPNIIRLSGDYQLLTFAETERELDQCLQSLGDANFRGSPYLRKLSQRKASQSEAGSLRHLSEALLLLAARANPILRPTIQEYQQVAGSIAAAKNKGTAAKLTRTEALRTKISARMSEIDDYMNWCEATKETTSSGTFANYFNAAAQQTKLQPQRHDAISIYLDALEEQVEN